LRYANGCAIDSQFTITCYDSRVISRSTTAPHLDITIAIKAPADRILNAFFDPGALVAWWLAARSVTTPRALGPYVIEWTPTDFRDEVLGRLGGVFHGTVVQFQAAERFFVADAYWLPPDGDPIGPMALEVTCTPLLDGTHVRVTQSGFEESARWRRYYEIVERGWRRALATLKSLLER
jgi:uncharacterized protein YndB with AHSA1/START domain